MKNSQHRWWIVGIVAAPFVLMLFLHIGIALGQYFKIDINVPNIAAADWFMFAGSYLGGAMTLLGVMATLRYERRIHSHQLMIQGIEKEKELLNSIINRIDIYAPSICYLDFTSALSLKEWNKRPDFSATRRKIAEAMSALNQGRIDLSIGTDMCCQPTKCTSCKHTCRMPSVRMEFQKTYTTVNKYLFDTLTLLDAFVVDHYQNAVRDELINLYHEHIVQCQATGNPSQYSEKDIQDVQNQKKDLSGQQTELEKRLGEISAINQKEMILLINLSREYVSLSMQNAERKCFGGKAHNN